MFINKILQRPPTEPEAIIIDKLFDCIDFNFNNQYEGSK